MKTLIVDNGSVVLSSLAEMVSGDAHVISFDALDTISDADWERIDLVVLSGSSSHAVVWEHDAFQREIQIIRSGIPVIGICFGCELIACAFDSTLKLLDEPHLGYRDVTFVDTTLTHASWLRVPEHHRWIIDRVGDELEVLAYSDDGPEAVRHRTLPVIGLQFHPEKCTDYTETRALFARMVREITTA